MGVGAAFVGLSDLLGFTNTTRANTVTGRFIRSNEIGMGNRIYLSEKGGVGSNSVISFLGASCGIRGRGWERENAGFSRFGECGT